MRVGKSQYKTKALPIEVVEETPESSGGQQAVQEMCIRDRVRGGGRRAPTVRQPEVRPRGRTARHELHRGGGGVMPPFPIGKPRRSVASALRRISEMLPPPSRICGKAETACFHVGLNVLLAACLSA